MDETLRAGLPQPFVVEQIGGARRPMRVAVVTETFPPEVNGVAVTIARFVDGLRESGHEIQLVRPRQGDAVAPEAAPEFRELLTGGVAIPRYPNLRMGLPARRSLERLWARHRPDVVHIVTEGPLGWSALRVAHKLRLPAVSDFRTNFHAYSRHYGVGWLRRPILAYLRKFHNATLCTMVPTEALRRELDALGFRALRVVARGVDTRLFDPARRSDELRRRWASDGRGPVLLYVGRLAHEKNLADLARAYEASRRSAPGARLVVVGDGPAREWLRARCPDAVFAGVRRDHDLAACYASADIFLFPSLTETFGNVTLEALASGLAVVAYDYAAAASVVVHGRSGALAPFGDALAFAETAARVAADPALVRTMGTAARLAVAPVAWERVVRQLEAILFAASQAGDGAIRGYGRARPAPAEHVARG